MPIIVDHGCGYDPIFNGEKALAYLRRICFVSEDLGAGLNPYTLKGSALRRYLRLSRNRAIIVSKAFMENGWTVEARPFEYKGHDAVNVIAYHGDGIEPGAVLIIAHHDYCAGVGAEDDGTALGVMLELAAHVVDYRNVVFASCDLEECGAIGSETLARELEESLQLEFKAVIALECLGSGKDVVISSRMDGVDSDRDLMYDILCEAPFGSGISFMDFDCFYSDHVPFARRGCKTAQMCSLDKANKVPASEMDAQREEVARGGRRKDGSVAHTCFDKPGEIKVENLELVGQTLLNYIRRHAGVRPSLLRTSTEKNR